jgi:hypothetical protein
MATWVFQFEVPKPGVEAAAGISQRVTPPPPPPLMVIAVEQALSFSLLSATASLMSTYRPIQYWPPGVPVGIT